MRETVTESPLEQMYASFCFLGVESAGSKPKSTFTDKGQNTDKDQSEKQPPLCVGL